jgi:hypothetical protein
MPTSQNRTKWPIKGGAVSIQPGWFPGHSSAQFYFNMGYGNEPLNYSHAMLPVFSITGPSNLQYDGTFCLPQVPLPAGYDPQIGDNATIQIIELAQHGASLYNVSSNPTIPDIYSHNVCDVEEKPKKTDRVYHLVRRHNFRRPQRRARSHKGQLLQLDYPRPEDRLPNALHDDKFARAT